MKFSKFPNKNSGFSFLEVMISALTLTFFFTGIFASFQALERHQKNLMTRFQAIKLAEKEMQLFFLKRVEEVYQEKNFSTQFFIDKEIVPVNAQLEKVTVTVRHPFTDNNPISIATYNWSGNDS